MEDSRSPLHIAIFRGHTSVVRLFIEEFGFPVDQIDYVETSLVIRAKLKFVAYYQRSLDLTPMWGEG